MPTVVLLDVSLSMAKCIYNSDGSSTSLIDIAKKNLRKFFNHLSRQCKLEYTSLMVFSSLYETVVKFTRDFDLLSNALGSLCTYDKTMFETALQGVESIVLEEWGAFAPINLIVITDDLCGVGDGSLKQVLSNVNERKYENRFPLPFPFPCNLSVLCLSPSIEMASNHAYLERLLHLNLNRGEILIPDCLTEVSIEQCFTKLLNIHYQKYDAQLSCGLFESTINLSPPLSLTHSLLNAFTSQTLSESYNDVTKYDILSTLVVVGFIDLQDFSNPPNISRHIVIPISSNSNQINDTSKTKDNNIGFQPSFCVLLHGSLKMEKMGAVVRLGENWYGMLYSYADSKKKSTLMLSIFEPNVLLPWLGELKMLGPGYELPTNPYQCDKENVEDTPFPVEPSVRRSYHSQSNAVWIKSSGLQSDVQKLLRYARKLPDKQSAFFKEVNKLRRAGVIYGFPELLNELASALETEGSSMQAEANVQLRHVAEGLRNAPSRDLSKNIVAINMFRKRSEN